MKSKMQCSVTLQTVGKYEKIKFKDNGMLLNNDLMLDRNFDNESNVLEELQVDSIFEPEVVN